MESVPDEITTEVVQTDVNPANASEQVPTPLNDSAVIDGIRETQSKVDTVGANITDAVNDNTSKIEDLANKTESLRAEVRSANDTSGQQASVVLLDDAQWSEIRSAWWQVKDTVSVALFLELVLVLLVSALIGCRLWDAFSKGWRK